ncbi:glycosyltransferase family 2 protein [Amphibacillus sp. Q70]|uniref:glycosyltransferase family 2 protein n=1 Tax=Amphibacillus sp. Q70 TaxID=3453416 RepID=UPI003F851C5B
MVKVSVIMPTYNNALFLGDAIDSILKQTFQDFEFIIVDDGSTDQTSAIVKGYVAKYPNKIKFIQHVNNLGAGQARNSGIEQSSANIIMLADADDIQASNRMEILYQELKTFDLVFNDCMMINAKGDRLGRTKGYLESLNNDNVILEMLKRNHFWSSLVMMKKTTDVHFDSSLASAEDFELFLRLFIKGYKFKIVDQSLTSYRIHQDNLSSDTAKANQSIMQILQRLDLDHLKLVLKEKHREVDINLAIAAAYLWRNEPMQVIELLSGSNLNHEGYFLLAVSYYLLKKYSKVKETLMVLMGYSNNAAIKNNLAVIEVLQNHNVHLANKYLNEAITLQPDYQDAKVNLEMLKQNRTSSLKFTKRLLRENLMEIDHYKQIKSR